MKKNRRVALTGPNRHPAIKRLLNPLVRNRSAYLDKRWKLRKLAYDWKKDPDL